MASDKGIDQLRRAEWRAVLVRKIDPIVPWA